MNNVDYFVVRERGSKHEINHFMFRDLKIALSSKFLSEQIGLSDDVISKLSAKNSFVTERTFKKLKDFFGIFNEAIFYELYTGLKESKTDQELKKFGSEFKENHALLFFRNSERVKRMKSNG